MIRLHFNEKGGNRIVLDEWDDVSMDHEIVNGKGKNRHYVNNEVLGLVGIYFQSGHTHYPDAINIVIEELENQPFIEEQENQQSYQQSN